MNTILNFLFILWFSTSNGASDAELSERGIFGRMPSTTSSKGRTNIDTVDYSTCFTKTLTCDPDYKYRTLDGSCNNLNNPSWGMSYTALSRILPANYRAINGYPVPLARKLSTDFFPDMDNQDKKASLAVMQWGQFFSHDVVSTLRSSNAKPNCCDDTLSCNRTICLPIQIPKDDPFYSRFNVTCQNMVRDARFAENCNTFGEQINILTHVVDASQVYGSDLDFAKSLREFEGGRLSVQTCSAGRQFLPSVDSGVNCSTDLNNIQYKAGEARVNQNPQLTILHTLLVREHNRVVKRLAELEPNWNDETLYQEGRAIVIAEIQHITYNEWLPFILGNSYMTANNLYSSEINDFKYNDTLPPVTINSFSTSALRVGHSAIQGQIGMFNDYNLCPRRKLILSDWLHKPGIIQQEDNFDQLLRGLTKQSMQKLDIYRTNQVTEQLFRHGNNSFGSDLLSIDIQRGRDNGIPPYVEFVYICTGNRPQTFADLTSIIDAQFIPKLEQYYRTVDDIELLIGANLEIHVPDARVGPTYQCIMGEQFYRYKYGDRFWYEIRGQPHSFTKGQLLQIKKATLSRLICDNGDSIKDLVPKGFLVTSLSNIPTLCELLPIVDLNQWK